ncbi:MAG: WD40 repeat domain-containing protein [Flavobacteriales bacterium]
METLKVNTNHNGAVYAFQPGLEPGHFFSSAGDRFVAQWKSEDLEQMPFAIQLDHPAFAMHVIPERSLLIVGTSAGNIHVFDLVEKKEKRNLAVHTQSIYAFTYLKKDNWLIAACADGTISIWHVPDWQLIRRIPLGEFKIRALDISSDGYHVAVGCGDGSIKILETMFFNEIYTLKMHEDSVTSVKFHPTKPVLLSGGKDGHLRVWNMKEDYNHVLSMPAHYAAIYTIAFSPEADYFVSTSRDKSFKLWNAETLEFIEKKEVSGQSHTHSVNCALWLDTTRFITGGDDRKIVLYEV